MKPVLQALGTQRLQLTCDALLSSYALNVDVRRYSTGYCEGGALAIYAAEESQRAWPAGLPLHCYICV